MDRQHTGKKHVQGINELVIAEELFHVNVDVYMLLVGEESEDNDMIYQDEKETNAKNKRTQLELIRPSPFSRRDNR